MEYPLFYKIGWWVFLPTEYKETLSILKDLANKPVISTENKDIYSFTKINAYYQCKYQYYLNYILKAEERPEKKENAFSEYGTFVHSIFEKYFKGELFDFELTSYYEDNYDLNVIEEFPPNAFADLGETYYNDGYSFLENFDGYPGYETIGVEQNFVVDFGKFKLRGFIDLILRDKSDGKIIIQDWKSKAKFKTKKEQKEYARQTYLYSKYIYDTYGEFPKTLRFAMFRKNTMCEIPFNIKDYKEAIEWASMAVNEIESCSDWKETYDEFYCRYLCDYRDSCKYALERAEEYEQSEP